MKWRKNFQSRMWFLLKNEVNFSYLDYLDFQAWLGMQINDLLEIENTDILCCYNFNKMKYV